MDIKITDDSNYPPAAQVLFQLSPEEQAALLAMFRFANPDDLTADVRVEIAQFEKTHAAYLKAINRHPLDSVLKCAMAIQDAIAKRTISGAVVA